MNKTSIGTISEKSIHRVLKDYLDNDISKHEVSIGGYIADICSDNTITEIQTRGFDKLRGKLTKYSELGYKTRIVYPVNIIKYINWIDPVTHEVLERRKSPIRSSISDVFNELYKIREYLRNDKLSFLVIALETEEYKYLDGYGPNGKNHATKIDKIPTSIIQEIEFSIIGGYEQFLPSTLPSEFNSKDYAKQAHCSIKTARTTLLILTELGIITRLGRKNRKYIYKIND